jgi:CheY-like chemotaxis protein
MRSDGVGSRVLIVDDEPDLLDTLRRLLGRCRYTCLTASSGADAVALMDAAAPDVVITDLQMSGIDGIAVARHAQGQRPPIPVVLMTAYATRQAERQAHSLGGTLYLAKPFACADLVDRVARALHAANPSVESGNGGSP